MAQAARSSSPRPGAGGEATTDRPGFDSEPAGVVLALEDLVRDANGEVVLYNDSNLRSLSLVASIPVVAHGVAQAHRTAAGEDVTGFRYMTFADGLTLFYQDSLDLLVRASV